MVVHVPYGLAVRIPGFHPGGLGSTPGMGIVLCVDVKQFFHIGFACQSVTVYKTPSYTRVLILGMG